MPHLVESILELGRLSMFLVYLIFFAIANRALLPRLLHVDVRRLGLLPLEVCFDALVDARPDKIPCVRRRCHRDVQSAHL